MSKSANYVHVDVNYITNKDLDFSCSNGKLDIDFMRLTKKGI